MHSSRWFLAIFFLYFTLFLSHALLLQKTVYGDGVYYYSWVRSAVVDRDINFTNDYAQFGVRVPSTPINKVGNKYPIGSPAFWLPGFMQAHLLLQGTGFELPYQLFTGALSVLSALAGLILLYRLLTEHFAPAASLLAVMSIAGASNLLFYGAADPVNSHAVSFFGSVVFLSFLFSESVSPFMVGAALGFCALVRPQDAILSLLSFVGLKKKDLFRPSGTIQFSLGTLLTFSPQFLAWYAIYGSPFVSPYLSGGESFTWQLTNVLNVLFSRNNGLFFWTPVTLLGFIGLLFWNDMRRAWFISVFLLAAFVIGSWSTWWQGASYSGRMFVSMLPLLAFGLASFFSSLKQYGLNQKNILLAVAGPLCVINALFIVRFLLRT